MEKYTPAQKAFNRRKFFNDREEARERAHDHHDRIAWQLEDEGVDGLMEYLNRTYYNINAIRLAGLSRINRLEREGMYRP